MSERWTPAEDAVLRSEYHRCASQQIGEAIGRSAASVRARARYLKLSGRSRIGKSRLRRRWTPAEDVYLTEHYVTQTADVIAKDLKRTAPSVQYRAKVLGLVAGRTRGRLWTENEESRLWQMWGTASLAQISKALSRTTQACAERSKVLGLGNATERRIGVFALAEKLGYTADQVQSAVTYLDLRSKHGWRTDPETGKRTYHKKYRSYALTQEQVDAISAFLKEFPNGFSG